MRRRAALLLCLVLIGVPARADWVMGRVVAVTDGDTPNNPDCRPRTTARAARWHRHAGETPAVWAGSEAAPLGSGIRQDGLGSFPQKRPVQAHPRPGARERGGCGPQSGPIRPGGHYKRYERAHPRKTGWPTLAPRRRLGQSGAVSGAIPGRCRRGSSAGTEACPASEPLAAGHWRDSRR